MQNLTLVSVLKRAADYRRALLDANSGKGLEGLRVALLMQPGLEFAAALHGTWASGAAAVPLSLAYPAESLRYFLEDSESSHLICDAEGRQRLPKKLDCRTIFAEEVFSAEAAEETVSVVLDPCAPAFLLYTSGTTGQPKGAVWTHANLNYQCETLARAWEWSPDDCILHALPLHHVHGLVNALLCPLRAGAGVEISEKFRPQSVLERLCSGAVCVFMGVPTMYYQLAELLESLPEDEREQKKKALNRLRLMVCGSAALPVSVLERWHSLTGHTLLERYGMTELGMALSNPYRGERRAGTVGLPLPGVEACLTDENGALIEEPETPGELRVRGPGVFAGYWNRPNATRACFDEQGRFRTGDWALRQADGYYRILGRLSADVIKSGGYKLSALEIEEALRTLPCVADCAVVGLPDEQWGEVVGAALVLAAPGIASAEDVRRDLAPLLPAYKIPRRIVLVPALPRNSMGKVVKNEVKKLVII